MPSSLPCRRPRARLGAAACLLALLAAPPGWAGEPWAVVPVGPLAAEPEPTAVADAVRAALAQRLAPGGHRVLTPEMMEILAPTAAAQPCEDGPCLADLGAELQVEMLIVSRLTVEGAAWRLTLEAWEIRSGQRVAEARAEETGPERIVLAAPLVTDALLTALGVAPLPEPTPTAAPAPVDATPAPSAEPVAAHTPDPATPTPAPPELAPRPIEGADADDDARRPPVGWAVAAGAALVGGVLLYRQGASAYAEYQALPPGTAQEDFDAAWGRAQGLRAGAAGAVGVSVGLGALFERARRRSR